MSQTQTEPAVSEDRSDAPEPEDTGEDLPGDHDYGDDDVDVDVDYYLDDDLDEQEYQRGVFVLREVIERQLIACRTLSTQLADAATDATVTLVESPARVMAAVRDGASLPSAFGMTGDTLADAAIESGGRIRAAVGTFVNSQAALPDALITSTAEVAGSVIRAQGSLASSAVDAAFTVATVATRGGDVRDSVEAEWEDILASFASARDDVEDALSLAQHRIQSALPVVIGQD